MAANLAELELELIQTHMTQKPMLRVEVCTRALRASQNVKKRCVPCLFAPLRCLSERRTEHQRRDERKGQIKAGCMIYLLVIL